MPRRSIRGERGSAGPGAIIGGAVACLLLGFVVTVLLPITGESTAAEAEPREYDAQALAGRALYIRESCFACHTQTVRDSFSDSLLAAAPSEAGLYENEAPNLIGVIRLGPDLSCVGDRQDDPDWYVRHLRDPAAVRAESAMPPFDYLSTQELRALASYLLRLTCEEG
ncbi:MAG: cbb3-type cytochrome c oxidase subunit II [Actinomycetota bacterium]